VLIDSFTAEKTDPEEEVTAVKLEVMKKTSENQGQEARLEIQTLSEILSAYGISFPELAEASPKAAKTKKSCGIAVMFLAGNPLLMKEMKRSGNLPLKLLEKKLDLPRKILERHRKYIIAGAEIIAGDFPILSEYLSFMRKENLR
jgi:RNA polymerase sigma factor